MKSILSQLAYQVISPVEIMIYRYLLIRALENLVDLYIINIYFN